MDDNFTSASRRAERDGYTKRIGGSGGFGGNGSGGTGEGGAGRGCEGVGII